MTNIPEEVVARMCALVRQLADRAIEGQRLFDVDDEARAIAALLPEPVDPDEAEAAAIANKHGYGLSSKGRPIVQAFMDAIKRGRELERAQP